MTAFARVAALPLLLLAAAGASAQTPPPPPLFASTCYPEYQSVFHWLDSDKTTEYSYDLRPLCGVDRFIAYPIPSDPARYWYFYFSLGGNISRQTFSCNPVWTPTYFSGGSFIQSYDNDRPAPTPPPGWPAKDPETGAPLAAPSVPCIVFAHTRPEWDLIDPANPATGGLKLSYLGLTEPASDSFNSCPYSDVYSGERPRKLTVNLLCDPAGSASDIKLVANPNTPTDPSSYYAEVDTCVYELTVSTKAACGSSGDPFDLPCASSSAAMEQQLQAGRPGTNFGYTVLGAVLLGLAQFAIARGALDVAGAALRSAGILKGGGVFGGGIGGGGGGGGGGAGAAAASLSSASATAPESAPFAAKSSYGAL
jgi:hypothetical protein